MIINFSFIPCLKLKYFTSPPILRAKRAKSVFIVVFIRLYNLSSYWLSNLIQPAILAIKLFALASLVQVAGRVVQFRALPEIEPHLPLFCERSEQKSLIARIAVIQQNI
jgi:hypothetical protein